MRKNKAHIYASPKGWNFRLESSNGKVIAQSNQGYAKKSEARRIITKYFPHFVIQED
jgi:uncharacterized protein YegP (UPF0339 family)